MKFVYLEFDLNFLSRIDKLNFFQGLTQSGIAFFESFIDYNLKNTGRIQLKKMKPL